LVVALSAADFIALTAAALPVVELRFQAVFVVWAFAGTSGVTVPGLGYVGTTTFADTFALAGVPIVESNSQVIAFIAPSFVLFDRVDDSTLTGEPISNDNGKVIAAAVEFEVELSDGFPSASRKDRKTIEVDSEGTAGADVECG
jgi:hypothetical protein